MTADSTALLISVLLMVLIAAWVPFLDACAGCVERRRQRRTPSSSDKTIVSIESASRRVPTSRNQVDRSLAPSD